MGSNMTRKPSWMLAYFGSDLVRLNVELIEESKRYAIVKLTDSGQKGQYSKVGYILVNKSGKYAITPHESLFEGNPTLVDLFSMKNRLEKKESQ